MTQSIAEQRQDRMMKQVVQSYRTGQISLEAVPVPACRPGGVLVKTACTLISIGTERSVIELGRKSLVGKAMSRPDLVKRAWAKANREGYWKTFQEALGRLDVPTPLGYSAAGTVIEVGPGAEEFRVGDRVACIGAGFASHAEVLSLPRNLCVKVPDGVGLDAAAFGMLGSIALHGVRLADAPLGSHVGVIGLGLLGLLTVQLLKASGCRVLAYDLDPGKAGLAKSLGADVVAGGEASAAVELAARVGHRQGLDAVIITASSRDNHPIELAAELCRVRGKIVLVGVARIELPRQILWEKEIEFQVSKASGPGALDPAYELEGADYPYGYVRWTERRNLDAFLDLIAQGRIAIQPLVTHRVPIDRALDAYETLTSPGSGGAIGVLLEYPTAPDVLQPVLRPAAPAHPVPRTGKVRIGVIGAGLFAKALLLPALKKVSGAYLRGVATASGVAANHACRKFGFDYGTTDYRALLDDQSIDAVVIATRHSLHARVVQEALQAGKHIFVEKPLCVNEDELTQLSEAYARAEGSRLVMVGFNRRFSPLAEKLKAPLRQRAGGFMISGRINVGPLAREHWVNSPGEGGGRIIGEFCHFVDFCQYLTDSTPVEVFAQALRHSGSQASPDDDVSVALRFRDGSVAALVYTASGDRAYSRERFEVFCDGKVAMLDDFRLVEIVERGRRRVTRSWNQELGYAEELSAFIRAVQGRTPNPLPFEEARSSTLTTFRVVESLAQGHPLSISGSRLSDWDARVNGYCRP